MPVVFSLQYGVTFLDVHLCMKKVIVIVLVKKKIIEPMLFTILVTTSVWKYKMLWLCEANVSRHLLVYRFERTYTLKDV
jgi:hypothetical protein